MAAATGCVAGLAILGNARLVLLPVALGFYVAGRVPRARTLAAAALVVVAAGLVVAPWVARNKRRGRLLRDHDRCSRAVEGEQPGHARRARPRGLDRRRPGAAGASPWPELAADLTLAGTPTSVDECAQMRLYRDEVLEFWRENPGEKARLAAQATRMLWNPIPSESDASGSGAARTARRTVEPVFMVGLYVLAIAGLFLAPRHFVALALLLLAYNTLAAMVFAGTTRYRVRSTSCSCCSRR